VPSSLLLYRIFVDFSLLDLFRIIFAAVVPIIVINIIDG
jgi:hypothetical protein